MASRRRRRCRMPRMQGAAVQCCMCITGVFMFLGGLIMLATGICLILNYGVFDMELLPPDLQNDEGKKTVGIILTSCGLVAILISVIVSLLYLCNKTKSSVVIPDDLTRMQSTSARNQTPDKFRVDKTDRIRSDRSGHEKAERRTSTGKPHTVPNGGSRSQMPSKSIPGSTEVAHPRSYKKRPHKKYPRRRLEEIKEQDAISRKTTEGIIAASEIERYDDTPRSGSFSSEMTNDEQRIPKVVLDQHEDERRLSIDSASTSQTATSDTSNFRSLDTDKSRRELQFIPSTVTSEENFDLDGTYSKDSVSILQKDDSTVVYNRGLESEDSSIVSNYTQARTLDSCSSNNTTEISAGGMYTQADSAQMTHHEVTYRENDMFKATTPPSEQISMTGEETGYTAAELPKQSDTRSLSLSS